MYEVRVREVPEHLAVVEQRNVAQPELFDYLVGAMARVSTSARDHGGLAGTESWPYLGRERRTPEPVFFVIYDGNPNDGPVPVEVCAPIGTDQPESPDVAMSRYPAHRQAYVRITKAQAGPTVGQAYEAVEQWTKEQGLEITGPPREVFFTDFPSAGPDDDVFDVAFPVA